MAKKESCLGGIPIATEGYPFIVPALAVGGFFFWAGQWVLAIAATVVAAFFAFFFRDPKREIPEAAGAILAPADGTVVDISEIENQEFPGGRAQSLSIFLSLFDIHINRAPVSGIVKERIYRKGKFLPAYKATASKENEQNMLFIDSGGERFTVRQIAGIFARRIVCWAEEGDRLEKGEKIGLIKFGSRVELNFPFDYDVEVELGQKVKGGLTMLAKRRD